MSPADTLLLLGAGLLAGIVGTAGGITSLISYPALLAAGLPALAANVANVVALVTNWPGSALASRPELKGQARWIARWSVVAILGGVGGALLLANTPNEVFRRIVPFLVAAASLGLACQPWLRRLHEQHDFAAKQLVLPGGLFGSAVYNGYFGAGAGVMVLTLMLVTVDRHMARANALKNMLVGAATAASAIVLVAIEPVRWSAVVPLCAGMFAGSLIGPTVARRVPAGALRWSVVVIGLGVAIRLWISPV